MNIPRPMPNVASETACLIKEAVHNVPQISMPTIERVWLLANTSLATGTRGQGGVPLVQFAAASLEDDRGHRLGIVPPDFTWPARMAWVRSMGSAALTKKPLPFQP